MKLAAVLFAAAYRIAGLILLLVMVPLTAYAFAYDILRFMGYRF